MRKVSRALFLVGSLILVPTLSYAQTLTGVVRDASGAVLPGVTVEASSEALIEKARTAVTDGTGQWRIVDLRPGIYALTFTLTGFTTVRREGIELTGSATLTVPAEMSVGNVQELITVTGVVPTIDTQTTRREFVLQSDTIRSLPVSRGYGALLTTIPALMTSGTAELFSSPTTPQMTFFTAHGGGSQEGRVMVDGLNLAAAFGGGGVSTLTYDVATATEVQVLISGGLGEAETGGPSINIIPRSGGNTFRGEAFYSTAGDWSRGENIDDELRAIGITRGPGLINQWDVNGSYGGPIKRDKLWFFGNYRNYGNARGIERLFANAVAGDPTRWDYVRDDNTPARQANSRAIYSGRLTMQATARQRVSFAYNYERRCEGSSVTRGAPGTCRERGADWVALGSISIFGNNTPEAHTGYYDTFYKVIQATWSMPVTSRLLFDAGFSRLAYEWAAAAPPDGILNLIPVQEQSNVYGFTNNLTYRGITNYGYDYASPNNWRAAATYVTGAHNMKVGYQGAYQLSDQTDFGNDSLLLYRFNSNNPSPPNRVTFRIAPWEQSNRTMVHSVYVQDQWTKGRMTLQGALRYDRASSWSPAEHNGAPVPTIFNAEPIRFDRTVSVRGYNDVTPRMGAAYDLFGKGKTAVKVNVGKYLDAATNDSSYVVNNPASNGMGGRFVDDTFRDWQDLNGNFLVDCDLRNPLAHSRGGDTCAQWSNLNFGNPDPTLATVNPAVLGGWGIRPYDWQFGASVQHEVLPRVSVEVGYNRRWFGNYTVTNNLTRSFEDYDPWVVTAPMHPRLPNGGGYQFTVYNLKPAKFGQPSRTLVSRERDYGYERTAYWHGVDTTINARLRNGFLFQGGTSTGRGVRDRCEFFENVPELFDTFGAFTTSTNIDPRGCRQVDRWITTFRGLSSYTVPRVGVLVSATIRSTLNNIPGFGGASNGTSLSANYNVPNTVVQQSLGRLPAGGTPTGNTTINLLVPGQMYGEDRVTLVDMRFAKVLRFGRRRADLGVDLYNIFNSNDVTAYNQTFGNDGATWLQPTTIVQPRFVRINVTLTY